MPRMLVAADESVKAGAYRLPGRKRPALCIEQNGVIRIYGTFQDDDAANEFMDRLGELVGARIEPRKEGHQ